MDRATIRWLGCVISVIDETAPITAAAYARVLVLDGNAMRDRVQALLSATELETLEKPVMSERQARKLLLRNTKGPRASRWS